MQAVEQTAGHSPIDDLIREFGADSFVVQETIDATPTLWVAPDKLHPVLKHLKADYAMLYDLFGIDERLRTQREGQPKSGFTVVYHLLSLTLNTEIRIKVAASEEDPEVPTISNIWPNANWYEREVWDMFGVKFSDHPNLYRILLPPTLTIYEHVIN